MKKALVIAAGSAGVIDALGVDYVIAADGGYDTARKNGICVNLLVGDMDSVKDETPMSDETLWLNADKDFTDTEAAIEQALKLGYKKIDVYGATGTRMDHTLANIFLLKKFVGRGADIRIIDEHNEISAIKNECVICGKKGQTVSFLPADSVVSGITLSGFKYPLADKDIEIGTTLTVSNVVSEEEATVKIKKGTLIMIIAKD